MTNKSNARYLGKVTDGPLIPVKQDPPPPTVEETAEGDAPEPAPEEIKATYKEWADSHTIHD